ncbi:alcohol dehydrogenase family protein [Actinomycetospora sp. OC33-EN08]|uniref:Alcohol dehydrogenase family protein n=1 Tax=Actinomycetospora aurantiaca TaxID=3129233 RepID=A0ABU8MZU0_9PSEU
MTCTDLRWTCTVAGATIGGVIPETMAAVLLTGHGGLERLEYRTDVPTPRPAPGEVLVQVAAAGVNNTDVNTRIGWYSKDGEDADATWSGVPLAFPRIQGADVAGHVVEVGDDVAPGRVGERVIVRTMLLGPTGGRPYACWTLGSECDGGFAQYVAVPASDTVTVENDWSDVELAAIPCAYSTAENMIQRAGLAAERVLVTGASGGVGLAAVQLARRRGASVVAVCSSAKADDVRTQGAEETLDRDADVLAALGPRSVDVVLDLVGGPSTTRLLDVLRPGGRYATSGAIGGPLAEIDLRTLYLNDLSMLGCTYQAASVFTDLVGYVERSEIRPVVSGVYPLAEIGRAQEDFLTKTRTGKLVLVPPGSSS